MEVQPYERGRFKVISHGQEFTVDVCVDGGNGYCDCPHFLSRLKPRIAEDKALGCFKPGNVYRCPHINAAREYLLDVFIKELIKQYPDNKLE